jgi:hypothetical protein
VVVGWWWFVSWWSVGGGSFGSYRAVAVGEHTPCPCVVVLWGRTLGLPERRARSLDRTRGARTRRDSARCARVWCRKPVGGALARRGAQATSEGRERDRRGGPERTRASARARRVASTPTRPR